MINNYKNNRTNLGRYVRNTKKLSIINNRHKDVTQQNKVKYYNLSNKSFFIHRF